MSIVKASSRISATTRFLATSWTVQLPMRGRSLVPVSLFAVGQALSCSLTLSGANQGRDPATVRLVWEATSAQGCAQEMPQGLRFVTKSTCWRSRVSGDNARIEADVRPVFTFPHWSNVGRSYIAAIVGRLVFAKTLRRQRPPRAPLPGATRTRPVRTQVGPSVLLPG